MIARTVDLVAVESPEHKAAARELVQEYLCWVAEVARTSYGLIFNIDAMIESDMQDQSKFHSPTGRFYLLQYAGRFVGVGCLKRLSDSVGEIQRMFVQPQVRGMGAGRVLVQRLLQDAKSLGYLTVRLESLKALSVAHALYRSVGFVEIDPYSENSMKTYQPPESLGAYQKSAVFMELTLGAPNVTSRRARVGQVDADFKR